jgi:hypothetical protein
MPGASASNSQPPPADATPDASVLEACDRPAELPQLPSVPRTTSRTHSRRASSPAHRASESQSDPPEARGEQLQQRYSRRSSTSSRRTTASTLPMTISASLLACPICLDALRDPALLCQTGITYCRACITAWLQAGKTTCPVTHSQLHTTALATNYLARSLLPQHQQAQSSAAQQAAAVDQALAALAGGSAREQAAAAEQLAALCVDNGVWAPSLQHNVASVQELVASKGAVPLLLGLCRAAPPPAADAEQQQVQVAALRALRNLTTCNSSNQKLLTDAGAAYTMVQLLAGGQQPWQMVLPPPTAAEEPSAAGAGPQQLSGQEELQLAAAEALRTLACNRSAVQDQVATAGGVPLVARLLWSSKAPLQAAAGCLLRNLLSQNRGSCPRLLMTVPGMVACLVALLRSPSEEVVAAAAITLCYLATADSSIEDCDQFGELEESAQVVVPLLPGLLHAGASPAQQEMACNALLCYCGDDWGGTLARLALGAGAEPALQALLASPVTKVAAVARKVLDKVREAGAAARAPQYSSALGLGGGGAATDQVSVANLAALLEAARAARQGPPRANWPFP